MGRVRFGTDQNRRLVARSARTSGLANGAAGDCSSYGSADSYGARGARQRSGGVEKYSSIASRQAPEHGSRAPAREAGAHLPRRVGNALQRLVESKVSARDRIWCFRLVAARPAPDACDRAAAPRRAPRSRRGGVEPSERKSGGVVGIYQRHDWAEEKRAALDAWSAHLLAAAEGRLTVVKVLPFSRAKSIGVICATWPRSDCPEIMSLEIFR